jgi:predicted SnoaL-like aldol condensation-catalyzing enzyme
MSPVRMERVESGIRTMLAFTEAHNRHDLTTMMDLVSENGVLESYSPAPDGTVYQGKKAITQYWQQMISQSPDAVIKIEDIFGFGLRCIMLWRYAWTDETGNKHHLRGVDICRLQDGLIQEMLSYVKG